MQPKRDTFTVHKPLALTVFGCTLGLTMLIAPETVPVAATSENEITAGIGEIVATTRGGSQTASVVRFLEGRMVVHVGDTVEWTSLDPVSGHSVTFGMEPTNLALPSSGVTVDADGARHAVLGPPGDDVHSGFLGASAQDRIGLAQTPLGVTTFRVTFTSPGTFPYICALHDELGMTGQVIVVP